MRLLYGKIKNSNVQTIANSEIQSILTNLDFIGAQHPDELVDCVRKRSLRSDVNIFTVHTLKFHDHFFSRRHITCYNMCRKAGLLLRINEPALVV